MLKTRAGRRFLCAAGVGAAALALVLGLRLSRPAYRPQAPEYRGRGPDAAPVELAMFSDFECGGCRASEEPLKQLDGLFPGKIRFIFKHMPWDFHRHAQAAAVAAECAGRAGKFWAYHDLLFTKQAEWVVVEDPAPLFARYARDVGAAAAPFEACRKDPASAAAVDADAKEAKDHWVRATPTFFVNGKRFVGVRQLRGPGFNLIERALKK